MTRDGWTGPRSSPEKLSRSGVLKYLIGHGDLVLPKPWRILGPPEGVTGILMCGLSAGLFFALVSRIYAQHGDSRPR